MTEYWDLYTATRQKTGRLVRRGAPIPPGFYHLSASAWLINSQGDVLLSQRHPAKRYPLTWECTGGAIRAGEDSLHGILRELEEELGLYFKAEDATLLSQTRRDAEQDFYDVYIFHRNVRLSDLRLQPDEIVAARWVDRATLRAWQRAGRLHPLIKDLP